MNRMILSGSPKFKPPGISVSPRRQTGATCLSVNSVVGKDAAADVLPYHSALVAEYRGEIPDQHPLQRYSVWFEAPGKHVVSEVVPVRYRRMGLQKPLYQIASFPNIELLGVGGEQKVDHILRPQLKFHL